MLNKGKIFTKKPQLQGVVRIAIALESIAVPHFWGFCDCGMTNRNFRIFRIKIGVSSYTQVGFFQVDAQGRK